MTDFTLDSNGDLSITNGDLGVSFSDPYHIRDIIQTFQGNWKESPTCGVGIFSYLGSNGKEAELTALIQAQLTQDGFINTTQVSATQDFNGQFKVNIPRNVVIGG